jgi:hypothetical protein
LRHEPPSGKGRVSSRVVFSTEDDGWPAACVVVRREIRRRMLADAEAALVG